MWSIAHAIFLINIAFIQDDHRRLNSNGTNASGKENEGNTSSDAVHYFLSPPPNKNKKNMMSAPKKKKLARTTTMQLRHDHPSYNPVTYYHKTPSSSSTDAVMVLMTLPPCTALLDFNSNKEYLDLATPRVLLDQFEKDTTATAAPPSLGDLEGTKDV